jgi:hypothetical protein
MKKKAGTKMVSYFMIYNKEPLLPITVSFLLPPTERITITRSRSIGTFKLRKRRSSVDAVTTCQ